MLSHNKHPLAFDHVVLFSFSLKLILFSQNKKKRSICLDINLLPHRQLLTSLRKKPFQKHCGKRKKMLITSIFSLNTLPNNKFSARSQLKGFADNKCKLKIEILFGVSRKHCGKRKKFWLPAFSPRTLYQTTNFQNGHN